MRSATRLGLVILLAAGCARSPLQISPEDLPEEQDPSAPGSTDPMPPQAPTPPPGPQPGSTPQPAPNPMPGPTTPPPPPPARDAGAPDAAAVPRDASPAPTPGAACANLPKCLADLFAACTPAGACVRQAMREDVNTCWANGVKMLSGGGQTRVLRPDGSLCYTVQQQGGRTTSVTWRSATGETVATGTVQFGGGGAQVPVTCAGAMPVQVPATCLNLQAGGGGGGCTSGACM